MLLRRTKVSESWLKEIIHYVDSNQYHVTHHSSASLAHEERKVVEQNQMASKQVVTVSTVSGRISGSTEWKSSRSETGGGCGEPRKTRGKKTSFDWDHYGHAEEIKATMTR